MNRESHNRRWPWLLLLLVCNLHLFGIGPACVARPDAILNGRAWTWLTHAFTHVSWYHLALDASAFLCLLPLLAGSRTAQLIQIAVCGAGALLLASWTPLFGQVGYCGLSGLDHGLMALIAMQWIAQGRRRGRTDGVAWALLAAVTTKAIIEACTGKVLLHGLHFGDISIPIVSSHLGGVLGAMLYQLTRTLRLTLPVCARQEEEVRANGDSEWEQAT
ncbi:MAG: rhomboid family intramembrane serine protease [Lentisphaerae bacterium]|nr:rhomboid family intramembrane serine protease [Lentisphaerota bacterium]